MATACGADDDRGVGRRWQRLCAAAVRVDDDDDGGTGRLTTMDDDGRR
jgi:hypothetical protein